MAHLSCSGSGAGRQLGAALCHHCSHHCLLLALLGQCRPHGMAWASGGRALAGGLGGHCLAAWGTAAASAAGFNHRRGQEGVQAVLWVAFTKAKPAPHESSTQEPTEGSKQGRPRHVFFFLRARFSFSPTAAYAPCCTPLSNHTFPAPPRRGKKP